MPDPVTPVEKVPFWQTNEGKKDICTIAGVLLDLINVYAKVIPPGVATAVGLLLRAVINIFGNPASTQAVAKLLFWGLLLSGLVGQANAGYLMPTSKDKMSLSLPSGTAIYLMPIEGFQVGVGLPNPTYGLSLSEDVVWGDMASVNGVPNLAPILGAGLSLYADAAGVINGTGPLLFLGGFNAVGPDLDLLGLGSGQGLVPNVLLTENFVSGETKITGGLTAFVDLGPGTAKKLF